VKRILFVDDEKNILDGIRRMLYAQRSCWEMHFALSGEAALEACEAHAFDVVISDMRMPGMDGATLLGHVRDRYPAAARLILSGYSELALATRAAPVAYRVLTKPCDGVELLTTIERVCTLQDIFCTPKIRQIIGSIGELPSLSSTYTALTLEMQNSAASSESVGWIIEQDVAMTAKILQLVNSGFFGLAQTITSLQKAVSYLGLDTMKNLALASDTFRIFAPISSQSQSYCEELQRHTHRTAIIAGMLPLALDPKERDIAVVSALLHDIGGLVLASKMPDHLCAVLKIVEESGCSSFEAEEELLGVSHAEIGAYLLGLWGINNRAVEAVAHHHRPTRIAHLGLDSSAALYLADLLASEIDAHPDDLEGVELRAADRQNLDELGLLQQFPHFRRRAIEGLAEFS